MNNKRIKSVVLTSVLFLIIACTNTVPNHTNSISQENFEDLDKEYVFNTKELTQSYIERKLNKWLDTVNGGQNPNGPKLVKEVNYARYKYSDLFCQVMSDNDGMLDNIRTVQSVADRKIADIPFSDFLDSGCAPPSLINPQQVSCNTPYQALGVAGGVEAVPGESPSTVLITTTGNNCGFCTGALLSSNRVLTSAHCVDGKAANDLKIWPGTNDKTNPGVTPVGVSSYVMHEMYNSSGLFSNDLAIINLSEAVTSSETVVFATLPPDNSDYFTGVTATSFAWSNGAKLQKMNHNVISLAQANDFIAPLSLPELTDNQISLYDSAQQVTSGSNSLTYYVNTLIGIGSVSFDGTNATYPNVGTRTSSYLAWIASN
jgi:hypothetical protein